jgi:hypothetical protein
LLHCAGKTTNEAPSVWTIDDGEKIRQDAIDTPFERGLGNPIWKPGGSVHLFALRGETVAFQVVIEAAGASIDAGTVSLDELRGPGQAIVDATGEPGAVPGALPVGLGIERFIEHFVLVRRPSGGRTPGESLGWAAGAGPPSQTWVGPVPDALVPVGLAERRKGAYPLHIAPHTNGIVWVDVNVPVDERAGTYRGELVVRDGARTLSSFAVDLEVADVRLPDDLGHAIAYYDPIELARQVGPQAEGRLWMLLRAHRVSPLHDATAASDVARQVAALEGDQYAPNRGYFGPGALSGDGVLTLGAYGGLGDPSAAGLKSVEAIAAALEQDARLGRTEVVLYADDESCASPRAEGWRALLSASHDEHVRRMRLAWTCSHDPSQQPVDVPILLASYDDAQVERAKHAGKSVWVYNGELPRTGTFLLDADAVSPRVNGWLQAMRSIPRWFYWEVAHWYGRRGAPFDPYDDPESLLNKDGDWANGDGVLVYPGTRCDLVSTYDLGWDGVIPSIRLKNWRRGLQDGAYLELARVRDRAAADAVADELIPAAFEAAKEGRPAAWSPRGERFFAARRALYSILLGRAPAQRHPPHATGLARSAGAALSVLGALALLSRSRRWHRAVASFPPRPGRSARR